MHAACLECARSAPACIPGAGPASPRQPAVLCWQAVAIGHRQTSEPVQSAFALACSLEERERRRNRLLPCLPVPFTCAHACCIQALLDTLLVLIIVAGSGTLLFGCNVALAEFSDAWYHRG